MRFVRKLGITPAVLIGFITTVTAFAQTQLQVEAPAPNPVNNASATITGNNGNGTYYYWVIANYPTGATFPTGPAVAQLAPSPLTASNYVKVSWAPVTGATTYDVVRALVPSFPAPCSACKVATTSASFVNDIGSALSSYTLTPTGPAKATITLDNTSDTQPFLNVALFNNIANLNYRMGLVSGTTTLNDCVKFGAAGILVDAGAACGTGSGDVTSFNTRTGAVTLSAADVNSVGAITNNTSGNAATATALAATPTLCTAGNAPLGVLANGNATGCQAVGSGTVTGSGVANQVGYWTGTNALGGNAGFTFDSGTGNVAIGTRVLSQTGDNLITPAFMIGQFSGTCNSSSLLGGDGVCKTISSAFSAVTSGTNNVAAMVIDTGASLTYANSGTINASSLGGSAAALYAKLASPTFTTPVLGDASATSASFPASSHTFKVWNNGGFSLEFDFDGTSKFTVNNAGSLAPVGGVSLGSNANGAYWNGDTSLLRPASGQLDVGTGSGDCSTASRCRDIRLRTIIGGGSAPGVSGCGTIGTGSTNIAGFITSTTGACVPVLTFSGTTATTGWSCSISNSTTPANIFQQTGSSTTTATFTGTSGSNDVLRYMCAAY